MRSELLLPVGDRDMSMAAIHNGADAIYVGFPGFNARGRTADLTVEELQDIIETSHLYGVKVNLALNVVIFQNEWDSLLQSLKRIIPLNPDALILQDLGLITLIREMFPNQVIHASTQMTVTNSEAIELLADLKIRRFVLGRENSLEEIQRIKEKTDRELEVFVHGALCVAYSGQCFTSESLGGRSANRGQCAQSCRLSYDLMVDGEKKDCIEKQYLVSPQDLCALSDIPELIDIGVKSFKVEGRLKSVEYVATTAREYRKAIDFHRKGQDLSLLQIQQSELKLGTTYSRGFFSGWLHGVDHQKLVDGTFSGHRGARLGCIDQILKNEMRVQLDLDVDLKAGDGILWAKSSSATLNKDEGAQIYEALRLRPREYALRFSNQVDLDPKIEGSLVYMNHNAQLTTQVQKSVTDKTLLKRIPVQIQVNLTLGDFPKARMIDGIHEVHAIGSTALTLATKQPVSDAFIQEELSALGGTVFKVCNPAQEVQISRTTLDPLFISHREVKELRRSLTEKLTDLRRSTAQTSMRSLPEMQEWIQSRKDHYSRKTQRTLSGNKIPQFNILLRNQEQVQALCGAIESQHLQACEVHSLTLDFEFGRNYASSIEMARSTGLKVGVATTRILKPQEYKNLIAIENLNPDHILIRNLGALYYFSKISKSHFELRGDFSLNVTNHLTAKYLLEKGLSTVCASYDLNQNQVDDLLKIAPAEKIEITIHQYMPSFHMEHCVFAAFLSKGSSYKDCGKPCEKHHVELKDQFGNFHHIKADPECRNTMFNAVAFSAANLYETWKNEGLGFVRYEALHESGPELIQKIKGYADLLQGRKTAEQITSELQLIERYGLGMGSLSRQNEYQSRKSRTPKPQDSK